VRSEEREAGRRALSPDSEMLMRTCLGVSISGGGGELGRGHGRGRTLLEPAFARLHAARVVPELSEFLRDARVDVFLGFLGPGCSFGFFVCFFILIIR
jgi:hypothetical protein